MSYAHLSIIERSKLEILHQQGKSARAIARDLGRHHATISRELHRNETQHSYRAERSQESYVQRRKSCIPSGKWSLEQSTLIEEKLRATWSPEQIVERLRQEGQSVVCFKTIYRWLYSGRLARGILTVLRHKGKRQKPAETRGKFAVGKTISQRPKEVRSRETFGHWELDTVVSGRGKSKGCLATFIERRTRLYTAISMPDRTALSMEIAFGVAASQYPAGAFQTATADPWQGVRLLRQPGSRSWLTGVFRRSVFFLATREFFPKGTDFAQITDEALETALRLINHRPRKCLGWRTAHESFSEELSHLA
ncbi:transposase, IS30 family [Paenibacillus sp. OK003]|nr:transposase, IS30 family [Paenibacillus sp. OK003]